MVTKIEYGKVYVKLELPGFDYASFIGRGCISPASILKICEQARHISYRSTKDFYEYSIGHSRAPFIVWQQLEATSHYAELLSQARSGSLTKLLQTTLEVIYILDPVGKSSQKFKNIIMDKKRNVPLFFTEGKVVTVDRETRRPQLHSDCMRRYFSEGRDDGFVSFNRTHPDMCVKKVQIPSGAQIFKHNAIVSAHEVDLNQHANQSAYVRFCFNCLAEAISSKFCSDLSRYIWDHPLCRVSVLYLKEAAMGDRLEVLMWRDESNGCVFHFHVVKECTIICQAEFELFESETQLVAKI